MPLDLGSVNARATFDTSAFRAGVDQCIGQLRRLQTASAGIGTSAQQGLGGMSDAYKRVQSQLSGTAEAAKQVGNEVKNSGEKSVKSINEVSMASLKQVYVWRQLGAIAGQFGQTMTLAGERGLRAIGGMVKAGADFQQMMITIRNNTMLTDAEFVTMQQEVKRIGVEMGANMEQVAMGVRHIRDYGFTGKAAFDMVSVAAKAGVATGTDVGDTAQLLSRTMRVFNIDVGKSAQVMNALWYAAANSNLMMKNLVDGGGRAIAMAGPMKLRFEEVIGILSVFSHQGLNINQASTQFINDLNKLAKPTKQTADYLEWLATKAGPDLRQNFSITAIQSRGVVQAFEAMAEKAKATGIPLAELAIHLFPNLRGVTGALIGSTAEGLVGLHKAMGDIGALMEGKTDPITARYNDVAKTLGVTLNRLQNSWVVLADSIATVVMPALLPILKWAQDVTKWFTDLPTWVKDLFLAFGVFGSGALIIAGQLGKLAQSILAIKEAIVLLQTVGGVSGLIKSLGLAGAASAVAPITALTAAIAGLAYAINKFVPSAPPRQMTLREGVGVRMAAIPPMPSLDYMTVPQYEAAMKARNAALRAAGMGPAAVTSVRSLGGGPAGPPPPHVETEEEKNARLQAARNRREAQIELLGLMEGAKNELKRKQKQADNEYINSVNDGTRTQQEAFRIRQLKYAEAQREYDAEVKKAQEERKRKEDEALRLEGRIASDRLKSMAFWQQKTRELDLQHLTETQKTLTTLGQAYAAAADQAVAGRRAVMAAYVELLREQALNQPETSGEMMGPRGELKSPRDIGSALKPSDVSKVVNDAYRREELAKWKKYTQDLAGVFEMMFDDLVNAPRNFFKDLLNMFKQMLIRMAAEWAASEVIDALKDLFGKGKGGGQQGGGAGGGKKFSSQAAGIGAMFGPEGAAIGAGIGVLGSIFHFAEGGWVPGPIGAPRAAIVHGGEYVVPAGQAGGGAIQISGNFTFHGVQDIHGLYRELGKVARQMAPVRVGS